jgi:2-haloacid dehalogenase
MKMAIAFDVYGTLVDPLAMADPLQSLIGENAGRFAELWRAKQLEYSFRRGLMRTYRPFSVCTVEALLFAEQAFGISLSDESRAMLMARYKALPAFSDAARGLASLKASGHFLAAFSNGEADALHSILENASPRPLLEDVVSADEVKTFKPDPAIYAHAVERLGQSTRNTWLVSSNPFDVIGAATAGLHTAWVRRDPKAVFDPWGVEPDLVVSAIDELAPHLCAAGQ